MDIEVGEYIRTDDGDIHKVIEILKDEDSKEEWDYLKFENEMGQIRKHIAKHSKNIIDLIEVGDILEIKTGLYSGFTKPIETEEDLDILKRQTEEFWVIKSILTHEQYESMCYKMED